MLLLFFFIGFALLNVRAFRGIQYLYNSHEMDDDDDDKTNWKASEYYQWCLLIHAIMKPIYAIKKVHFYGKLSLIWDHFQVKWPSFSLKMDLFCASNPFRGQ